MSEQIFFGQWDNEGAMIHDFQVNPATVAGAEILLASYGLPAYEGYAFVLLRRGDKLFEVNGGHCSCRGLEDQWQEEETSWVALKMRFEQGDLLKDYQEHDPMARVRLGNLIKKNTEQL